MINQKDSKKNDFGLEEDGTYAIGDLVLRLEKSHQVIDELVKVNQTFGHDYDRDKAYAEDIEANTVN